MWIGSLPKRLQLTILPHCDFEVLLENKMHYTDISGKRFNGLTAINFHHKDEKDNPIWIFRCDCGKEVLLARKKVVSGHTKSCGCKKHKKNLDITGMRFGKLVAISKHHYDSKHNDYWLCKCDCGKETTARRTHLLNGNIKSCGCLLKEWKGSLKHGCWARNKRLFKIWQGMHKRCYHPSANQAKFYKDKGVIVCKEWHDPVVFEKWALANGYADGLTIDRIDNDGNYCPENCRWVSVKEQARNKSTTHWIMYKGKKMCLTSLMEMLNIPKNFYYKKRKEGFSDIEIINLMELYNA